MNAIKCATVGAILSLAAAMPNAYAVKDGAKYKDWEGKCETVGKQKICGIAQRILDADKKPIVNIFIRKVKGQKDPLVFVKVPLGVDLRGGLGFAVDHKQVAHIPYAVCDPVGCNAIFPLTSEISAKMKKGSKFQVAMLVNKEMAVEGSLSGFTNALKAL